MFFCLLTGCSQTASPPSERTSNLPSAKESSTPGIKDILEVEPDVNIPPKAEIELKLVERGVEVKAPWPKCKLYRGYQVLQGTPRESRALLEVNNGFALDEKIPSVVKLHYLALGANNGVSRGSIEIPTKKLPRLHSPELEVDKTHCVLEVREGQTVKKRYPIALGANPVNRKYCQDMASTPEGWYEIYNLQPNAT